MKSRLTEELTLFDFSTGEKFVYVETYDVTDEENVKLLDGDSADASALVAAMELNYDINARHYSTVIDGDHIVDMVEVEWRFWK